MKLPTVRQKLDKLFGFGFEEPMEHCGGTMVCRAISAVGRGGCVQ